MHASTLSLATSIPTTTRSFCAIIQLPSLLGPGSKPMQLFGLRKTPDLSLAPRQALGPSSTNGLGSSDGRLPINRPFAHSGRFCGHKSTKETVKTIACGNAGCSGATVVTTLVCFLHFAHEAAGAAGTRHSPRPLFSGRIVHARLGRIASRECGRASFLGCLKIELGICTRVALSWLAQSLRRSSLRTQGPITTAARW